MLKSEFKKLVKQCLIEILQEGIGEVSFIQQTQPILSQSGLRSESKVQQASPKKKLDKTNVLDTIAKQHQNNVQKKQNAMLAEQRRLEQRKEMAREIAQSSYDQVEEDPEIPAATSASAGFAGVGAANVGEMAQMKTAQMNENVLPFDPMELFGNELGVNVGAWGRLAGTQEK
jgi:hypothetical protein